MSLDKNETRCLVCYMVQEKFWLVLAGVALVRPWADVQANASDIALPAALARLLAFGTVALLDRCGQRPRAHGWPLRDAHFKAESKSCFPHLLAYGEDSL